MGMGWRSCSSSSSSSSRGVLGVVINVLIVGLLLVSKQATGQGAYACWGGCYNGCILQNGQHKYHNLACFWNCLGTCIAHTASDYHYYCQLGCSLKLCMVFTFDGGLMFKCIENCSSKLCNASF